MLPDRSVLIGQKLVENAKIQKFKCDIFIDFQTMCDREYSSLADQVFDKLLKMTKFKICFKRTTYRVLGPRSALTRGQKQNY